MRLPGLTLLLALAAFAQTDRPQLLSSTPAQGQDAMSPSTQIKLVFSKPIDPNAPNISNAFTLYDLTNSAKSNGPNITFSTDGLTLSLTFYYLPLRVGAAYRLDLDATILKDRSGNLLAPVAPIMFNTFAHPDKSGPKSAGTVPADGEIGAAINSSMYVVFDKPIAALPYDAGITVTAAAGPLKFTSTVAGDRILQIKTPLLLPANQQIAVRVSGIVDRNGATLAAPLTYTFSTGVLADVQTQSLKLTPPAGVLLAFPLHVAFSKPVDPPLMMAGSVVLQTRYQYSSAETYPATYILGDDRRTLTIDAPAGTAGTLPPGGYTVAVSIPFDRTLGQLNAFQFSANLGVSADPTPAQVLGSSPPDGAVDSPAGAAIRLIFSQPVDLAGAPGAITLTANGANVPGDFSVDYTGVTVTFKPRSALQPSTTYTLAANGLSDFAGNAVPSYSASFTTRASGTYTDTFKVLSVTPANAATGVDPLGPIVFTFSHVVDPISLYGTSAILLTDSNGQLPIAFSVEGAVLTVRPKYPMSNGYVTVKVVAVADLAGIYAQVYSTLFQVAGAQPDTTPPTVSSVVPANGATVLYSAAHVELTFSKPVNPGTLTMTLPGTFDSPLNFVAFRDGLTTVPLKTYALSNTRVALEFSAPPGVAVTLLATSGIADFSGNSLAPFRTTVLTSSPPVNGAAHVIRQAPNAESSFVYNDATVTAYWSAPLDRASVEQNFLIYTADGPVSGRFEWSGDSRAFAFIPDAAFKNDSAVTASLGAPAHDAAGLPVEYRSTFRTSPRYTPPTNGPFAVTGGNFSGSIPLNAVIDLQFNQDFSQTFLQTAKATLTRYQQPPVNCPFVRLRSGVLRFTLPVPLLPSTSYVFAFDGGKEVTTSMQFTPANVLASAHPTVIAAGPVGTDVPQNSSISVLFSEPVSRLGMPGGVKVLANGVAVSMPFNWTSETGLTLQPGWFLRAATTYTVTLSGFENLAGIPLPDFTWTFRTGSAIDTATPTLLRILPSGSNVSPDAAVAFAFDKAVAPDSAASHFSLAYAALSSSVNSTAIASTLGFSDDLRTVYLRPNAPLGAGASVNAAGGNVADFAGNTTGSAGFTSTFQVSYKGSAPAAVTGANPRPDSNGVPLNATIQVQYSARITLFSDIAATLTENGTPLDLTLRVAGDGRTLTLIPSRLLAANSLIDVTVTGVAPAACHFSFSTGTDPDLQSPAVTVWPTSELSPVPPSVVLRLRFSERLNPLTVSSDSVTLRAPNNALIDATASLDDSGRMVTLTPRLPLIEGQRYNASWSVGDLAGNLSTAGTYFTIGSPDNVPTTLRGIDPADGASDVSTRPLIQAFFTRPVEFTLGNDSFRLMADGVPVPGTIGIQGSQLSFNPTRALIPGAAYRIETRGMADVFGNAVPDAASTFTVASPGDAITQLRLLSSSPANGAVGIPADASIRLTFNKPVTTGSALALTASASYYGTNPYLSTRIEGNDVVIQPTAPFNGGSQVSVRGTLRDTAGSTTQVSFSYLVTPVPDNTPPVLEYMFPAAGSTVPISGVNLVLRFSEPVTFAPNAIRIIGGSNPDLTGSYLGADGRTLSMVLNLIADADITIALGNGVTDLAGNPMAPVSYQLHSLSAEESSLPKVKSITPPLGANDVPVDTPIQLQFTHAMEPVSTAVGLQVSADNVPVTGSAAVTPDAHGLQFKPDIPFRSGARVAATVRSPAQDTAGQRIEPFESYFTVVKDAILAEPAPLAISASASAIDVRFDAPLGRRPLAPYIRSGFALIPSHWELRGSDWLRVVPDQPLDPGRDYRLILDSQSEFPLHPHAPASAAMRSALYDGTAVRLRFDGEVNLLTVSAQTLQLSTPDGAKVAYYLEHSLDRRELVLRPATSEAALVLILNGSESAGGVPIPRQRHRLSPPK